jgi:hypothetical protein
VSTPTKRILNKEQSARHEIEHKKQPEEKPKAITMMHEVTKPGYNYAIPADDSAVKSSVLSGPIKNSVLSEPNNSSTPSDSVKQEEVNVSDLDPFEYQELLMKKSNNQSSSVNTSAIKQPPQAQEIFVQPKHMIIPEASKPELTKVEPAMHDVKMKPEANFKTEAKTAATNAPEKPEGPSSLK